MAANRKAAVGISAEGKQLWSAEFSATLVAPAALDGERARVIGLSGDAFQVLDGESGRRFRAVSLESRPRLSPVPTPQGFLLVDEDRNLVHRWTELHWTRPLPRAPLAPALVQGKWIYQPCGPRLLGLSLETGDEVWSVELPASLNTPAHHQGSLYVTAADGRLYVLSASSGELRWSYGTEGPLQVPAVIDPHANSIYIASDDFRLHVLQD